MRNRFSQATQRENEGEKELLSFEREANSLFISYKKWREREIEMERNKILCSTGGNVNEPKQRPAAKRAKSRETREKHTQVFMRERERESRLFDLVGNVVDVDNSDDARGSPSLSSQLDCRLNSHIDSITRGYCTRPIRAKRN